MSPTLRLALKLTTGSAICLLLGAAILYAVLTSRVPKALRAESFAQLGHSSSVRSVAWSPDGKTLASGSSDNTVKLWDSESGQLLRTLSGHTGPVESVAWSPDGKTLASGSDDNTLKLWDSESGQLLRTLSGHSDRVNSVAWSPDGKTLASGSYDSTVKQWDSGSGQLLRTLSGHADAVFSVAWSPDGKKLASGSSDSTVQLDSLETNAIRQIFQLPGNEWLSRQFASPRYLASLQGNQYFAVRFENRLRPVYPLAYYRADCNNAGICQGPVEDLKPKPIRYAWDNFPNKPLWLSAFGLIYLSGLVITLVVAQRSDPTHIARNFFAKAGFEKITTADNQTLLLGPKIGSPTAIALVSDAKQPLPQTSVNVPKTYIIYSREAPPADKIQSLRQESKREVIPLSATILARALSEDNCRDTLRELEAPFVSRTDPYDESRPIEDPTWFYGRKDLIERLPSVLRQGQHVGLFGLRKVGKTSLIYQLRQHLAATPTVFIDCQALPPKADALLSEILTQLFKELPTPKRLPATAEDFRTTLIQMHEKWQKAGHHGPFILIFDEVDKLFPDRRIRGSEDILAEWVKLFRILRGLAQERKCLATLVTAYRPDVNTQNKLSPEIGENPMFMSFQEYFLGTLNQADTEQMVSEIGGWKNIRWTPDSLSEVYELCGGHPLIARFFASDACQQGDRKEIDLQRVRETASAIVAGFHKHRIGRYFEESVWNLLQPDEQAALTALAKGATQFDVPQDEAASHLDQFGLIRKQGASWRISAKLLEIWLERSAAKAVGK